MGASAGAVAALALAAASWASVPAGATRPHPPAHWSRATTAQAFASEVLAQAPLPPGAKAWRGPLPAAARARFASPGPAGAGRTYLVHQPAAASMLAYVLSHLPVGSSRASLGWAGDRRGQTSEEFTVTLPTFGPDEYSAALSYSTTTSAGRGCLHVGEACLLQVKALTVWEPRRSPAETAPVHDRARLGIPAPGPVVVAPAPPSPVTINLGLAQSAKLARAFDALPLAPAVACMEDSPLYTVSFRPPPGRKGEVFDVTAWACASQVSVALAGRPLHLLYDARHLLLDAVCQLAPRAATKSLCPAPRSAKPVARRPPSEPAVAVAG